VGRAGVLDRASARAALASANGRRSPTSWQLCAANAPRRRSPFAPASPPSRATRQEAQARARADAAQHAHAVAGMEAALSQERRRAEALASEVQELRSRAASLEGLLVAAQVSRAAALWGASLGLCG
jgi:hypothetical protein